MNREVDRYESFWDLVSKEKFPRLTIKGRGKERLLNTVHILKNCKTSHNIFPSL